MHCRYERKFSGEKKKFRRENFPEKNKNSCASLSFLMVQIAMITDILWDFFSLRSNNKICTISTKASWMTVHENNILLAARVWCWAAFSSSQKDLRWKFEFYFSLADGFVLICSFLADEYIKIVSDLFLVYFVHCRSLNWAFRVWLNKIGWNFLPIVRCIIKIKVYFIKFQKFCLAKSLKCNEKSLITKIK